MSSRKGKLLIIDDDDKLVEAVELYLNKAGYDIITAADGLQGIQQMYSQRPDLIILDVMMPTMDGWETCRRIREISDVPVIMLTARGQESDRVMGLKLGADDYVAKPFSLKELEARVEAVLRRARLLPPAQGRILYADDELVIDSERLEVNKGGERVQLTATKQRLLFYLAENAGRVLTNEQILETVWGAEYVNEADYVKLYIWRLRQKIEEDPHQPKYILTERGLGYRFAKGRPLGFLKP
ncbi:MAG: response regulator transcription factor [Anaerolineales bacterium]|nr:response regulator transcription factor [Anaerolineales bacterium]